MKQLANYAIKKFDFGNTLLDECTAKQVLYFLAQEGFLLPEEYDIYDFMDVINYNILKNNNEIFDIDRGDEVPRTWIMTDYQIACMIDESYSDWNNVWDLIDYLGYAYGIYYRHEAEDWINEQLQDE